jgi:CTP:molybdopterin cytidylyltransferase MocA
MHGVGKPPLLRGLVLAGGRSQRMGHDKAAILIDDATLLERTVALLDGWVASVSVSVRSDQADDRLRRQYPLLLDTGAGLGPANGLRAAHLSDPAAAWLVLACDMPGLDRQAISALVAARDPVRAATSWRSPWMACRSRCVRSGNPLRWRASPASLPPPGVLSARVPCWQRVTPCCWMHRGPLRCST